MDATVKPLTDVEREWLRSQLAAAARFVADYGSQRHPSGFDALDHAWASWLDRQSVDPEDPDIVINAVGVAFGQALVNTIEGFDWVIAEDADGTDLAVFGRPGAGDVLIYPANVVSQRYGSREQLRAAYDTAVSEISQLRG